MMAEALRRFEVAFRDILEQVAKVLHVSVHTVVFLYLLVAATSFLGFLAGS